MSLESVTAFQPFVMEPARAWMRQRGIAGALCRRLASVLRWGEEPAVSAQLTGAGGPPDVEGVVRAALGADCMLRGPACGRLPKRGPVLVLIFRRDRETRGSERARSTGNAVSPAALARILRGCDAPVLPVLALPERKLALAGGAVSVERLARIHGDAELLRWLRLRAGVLRHSPLLDTNGADVVTAPLFDAVPIADPVAPDLIETEIAALPQGQRLVESRRFLVVQARAHQVPACTREVGRLRELTFRAAGEGTGRALDLDAHDRTFRHLLLFDRAARRIAGAYRFAPTDEILPVFGVRGLYTSTLFHFEPELFEALGPALELGRSFVCLDYQRTYAPLLLLWRGLCAFVARSPRYRTLFGAVSVSATYARFSRQLMATALDGAATRHPLAIHVAPRNPLRPERTARQDLRALPALLEDVAELSAVVSGVEPDGKGIPVLRREYLKLGGRLLGFSVDPSFGDTLDGLIAVDLARSEQRLLELYMGRAAARAFLGHHSQGRRPAERAA